MSMGSIGLGALGLAYFLSQFYRSFLAVLYPALEAEIGLTEAGSSEAQGAWFAVFALAQFPIGWALDTIGPRRTAGILLSGAGTAGCIVFAMASSPADLTIAMGLIGLGCAPVLMASYFIYAREFDPTRFATYAGLLIGFGTLGNVLASEPLAALTQQIGWRNTALALAAVSLAVGAAILVFVRDPKRLPSAPALAGILELLRLRALWLILPMILVNYAAAANLRSPWVGSFIPTAFGLEGDEATRLVGVATFWMAVGMAIGTLAYGPMDRVFGTRKGVVIGGNIVVVGMLILLASMVSGPMTLASTILIFALIGAFGHSYAVVVAHGQSFLPPHLVGRGVTFLNFFSIGGVALMQILSAQVFDGAASPEAPLDGYQAIFILYAVALTLGMCVYFFSSEPFAPSSYLTRRRLRQAAADGAPPAH